MLVQRLVVLCINNALTNGYRQMGTLWSPTACISRNQVGLIFGSVVCSLPVKADYLVALLVLQSLVDVDVVCSDSRRVSGARLALRQNVNLSVLPWRRAATRQYLHAPTGRHMPGRQSAWRPQSRQRAASLTATKWRQTAWRPRLSPIHVLSLARTIQSRESRPSHSNQSATEGNIKSAQMIKLYISNLFNNSGELTKFCALFVIIELVDNSIGIAVLFYRTPWFHELVCTWRMLAIEAYVQQ